jgi:hypothetical protein
MSRITIDTENEMTTARIMSIIQRSGISLSAAPAKGMDRGIHLKAREATPTNTSKSYQILEMDAYRRRLA